MDGYFSLFGLNRTTGELPSTRVAPKNTRAHENNPVAKAALRLKFRRSLRLLTARAYSAERTACGVRIHITQENGAHVVVNG